MRTSGGGVSPSNVGTKTPLAPVVVSPVATCTSGVFPSTHWHRYRPSTQATCTVCRVQSTGGGGGEASPQTLKLPPQKFSQLQFKIMALRKFLPASFLGGRPQTPTQGALPPYHLLPQKLVPRQNPGVVVVFRWWWQMYVYVVVVVIPKGWWCWVNWCIVEENISQQHSNPDQQQGKWSFNCYIMVHEQSACTYTSFAHAVAIFHLHWPVIF